MKWENIEKDIQMVIEEQIELEQTLDVTEESKKMVVPMELIKESLKNVTFIGGMDECLCREANDCICVCIFCF